MKRLIYPLLIVSLICTMSACSKIVGKLATAYTASKDSTQIGQHLTPAEEDSVIIAFITKMYNEGLWCDDNFIRKHSSEHFLKELHGAGVFDPESDIDERQCVFALGAQDAKYPSNHGDELVEVKSEGGGWYTYEFYDSGYHGINHVKAYIKDGIVIIDNIDTIYNGVFQDD